MLILLLALLWFTSHPARLQHLALFCPTPESMLLGLKHAASGIAWRVRKQWQFEGRKRRSQKKQSYLLFHRFLHCIDATYGSDTVFHDIHHNALIMYNVRRYLRVLRVIVLAQVVSFFKNWGVCVQHSEMQTCKLSLETWTCESGLAYNLWVLVVLRSVFPFKKDCRIVTTWGLTHWMEAAMWMLALLLVPFSESSRLVCLTGVVREVAGMCTAYQESEETNAVCDLPANIKDFVTFVTFVTFSYWNSKFGQ